MSDTPAIVGGEEAGTTRNPNRLRPSELALIRRAANRIPFTDEDRLATATTVMEAMRSEDATWRTKLAAVRAFGELERVNLAELALAIGITKEEQDRIDQLNREREIAAHIANAKPNVTNNVNILHIEPAITEQGRIEQALALLDAARARGVPIADGAASDKVHPALSDRAADGVPETRMP